MTALLLVLGIGHLTSAGRYCQRKTVQPALSVDQLDNLILCFHSNAQTLDAELQLRFDSNRVEVLQGNDWWGCPDNASACLQHRSQDVLDKSRPLRRCYADA